VGFAVGMDSAMTTAVSGIQAATTWLDVAASNIANMRTSGSVPATSPQQPLPSGSSVYQAVTVQQVSQTGGGVSASFAPVLPSWVPGFYAPSQTAIAEPNVDMATQLVTLIQARAAFGASVAVFRAADNAQKSLLNLIS
jgi:flagellar basal-body rod protein FlgC